MFRCVLDWSLPLPPSTVTWTYQYMFYMQRRALLAV
jgi:hypothetical protein